MDVDVKDESLWTPLQERLKLRRKTVDFIDKPES